MRGTVLTLLLLSSTVAQAADFKPWTDFPNARFKGTRLWRDAASGAYCYVTGHSRIDADGAPNAYHPGDHGRKKPPYLGLDNPANAGWPGTNWWSSVLVRDPDHPSTPFVQKGGAFDGYFVAQSALRVKGGKATDPKTYADARTVPYTVLPGSVFPTLKGTGAAGDVGFAWNLANGKSTAFVVGDAGGGSDAMLGEGSIALFERLGGQHLNARNGLGVAPGKMRFILFPGTHKTLGWPAGQAAIDALAQAQLNAIGGVGALTPCIE